MIISKNLENVNVLIENNLVENISDSLAQAASIPFLNYITGLMDDLEIVRHGGLPSNQYGRTRLPALPFGRAKATRATADILANRPYRWKDREKRRVRREGVRSMFSANDSRPSQRSVHRKMDQTPAGRCGSPTREAPLSMPIAAQGFTSPAGTESSIDPGLG